MKRRLTRLTKTNIFEYLGRFKGNWSNDGYRDLGAFTCVIVYNFTMIIYF